MNSSKTIRWFLLAGVCCVASAHAADTTKINGKPGQEFRIPYRLAPTNHTVVRVRLNDQGPFNFIIDTGAPALFIDPAVAKKCNIAAPQDQWSDVARVEIEGGVVIEKTRARVQELYQTAGMNAMTTEKGREIVGVLGYNTLARFKLDFDFTRPYMIWTRLDFEPPRPKGLAETAGGKVPEGAAGFESGMGNMAKMMQGLMGNRPKVAPKKPGYLGIELDPSASPVKISAVHRGSPAEAAGVKDGDTLLEVGGQAVRTTDDVIKQSAHIIDGGSVNLKIERKGETQTLKLKAGSGL